jgi:hypothetical protein
MDQNFAIDGVWMLFISAATPFILEKLKWQRWFPLMQPYASKLNRITPLVVSALVAAGITIDFDHVNGVLTIAGLIPGDIVRGLLLWGFGAITQHVSYERAIRPFPKE